MSRLKFDNFFQAATGNTRYDYQCRLAGGDSGTACRSQLINVPTGLGKTAAVVLAWLWNRLLPSLNSRPSTLNSPQWPRRLVYCLPMRTLVEQTRDEVEKWLANLSKKYANGDELKRLACCSPVVLMGGEELDNRKREWHNHPEHAAIIIGTQDMLLSRALNRGYAAGRARWPKDFALLNNDCVWVFDEVQLMGSGFATSLQLQAWRQRLDLRPLGGGFLKPAEDTIAAPTFSWWMSATLDGDWLKSAVDFRQGTRALVAASEEEKERLWSEDPFQVTESAPRLKKLLYETMKQLGTKPSLATKGPDEEVRYCEAVAKEVAKELANTPEGCCLVILNTVRRACRVAEHLQEEKPFLLHSRFRPRERQDWVEKLTSPPRLIVATQVVEAGVDVSARLLFTELCPWPSFIQRLGRAARRAGEEAKVFWFDVRKAPAPYPDADLEAAFEQIEKQLMGDVSLKGIKNHADWLKDQPSIRRRLLPYEPRFVPRDNDLFELFDTTPDLTGADVDIARFIRDSDELDVQVFWRDCNTLKREDPPKSWRPEHAELCPVPVGGEIGFRQFMQKKPRGRVWRWDYRDGWTRLKAADADRVYPGQIFLLEVTCGGYRTDTGWTGEADHQGFPLGPWQVPQSANAQEEEATDPEASEEADSASEAAWQSITEHSRDVARELEAILGDAELTGSLPVGLAKLLRLAVRLHDWGKAHRAFFAKLKPEARQHWETIRGHRDWPAKAPGADKEKGRLSSWKASNARELEDDLKRRPGFRHELASALGILELLRRAKPDHAALAWPDDADLRAEFAISGVEAPEPMPVETKILVDELAALTPEDFDLLLYLVAAHHGKVRMSLRSAPDDSREDLPDPCPADKRQARGVRDGDAMPPVALPGPDSAAMSVPAMTLNLDPMELGLSPRYGRSWRERTQTLLETHGPFRLAWYETLLRIADARASRKAENRSTGER